MANANAKVKGTFTLKKAAKSSGGDRYTGELAGESLDIYIPQVVSHASGASTASTTPKETLTITVS